MRGASQGAPAPAQGRARGRASAPRRMRRVRCAARPRGRASRPRAAGAQGARRARAGSGDLWGWRRARAARARRAAPAQMPHAPRGGVERVAAEPPHAGHSACWFRHPAGDAGCSGRNQHNRREGGQPPRVAVACGQRCRPLPGRGARGSAANPPRTPCPAMGGTGHRATVPHGERCEASDHRSPARYPHPPRPSALIRVRAGCG